MSDPSSLISAFLRAPEQPKSTLAAEKVTLLPCRSPAKQAYVTLLTSDDFLPGVQVLLHTLLASAQLPLDSFDVVVLVPINSISSETRSAIRRAGCGRHILIREVPAIPNPHSEKCHIKGWVNSGFTKLHVWALTEYNTVVYIDADAIVRECVDELFGLALGPPGSFAAAPDVFPPDRFNAGVLVVRPDLETFEALCRAAIELASHDKGDTGFLNSYFSDWFKMPASNRLSFGYNAQRTMFWMTAKKQRGYWEAVQPLKIVHYSSSPKPWEDPKRQGELEADWWRAYFKATPDDALALGGEVVRFLSNICGGSNE